MYREDTQIRKMKKKNLLKVMGMVGLCLMLFTACGGKTIESTDSAEQDGDDGTVKVGLIVGTGGLGDQNFNDLAYAGLEKARDELGITFDYSEPQSASDYATYITQYAEDGSYDLIMLNASEAESALAELAPKYPDQKFSIIDTTVDADNVVSLVKEFRDYTFLGGYLAGAMTGETSIENINEDEVVGIVVGVDSPVMQEGALGFRAGAKLACAEADVRVGIVGAFDDPATAKEITKSIYDDGGDIVMALAGGSSLGTVNQAKESSLYAIGCTSENQIDTAPDNVMASCVESLDTTVYTMCQELIDGKLECGERRLGIDNDYFVLSYGSSNVPVPQELKDKIEDVVEALKSGELVIPETEEEIESWAAENSGYSYGG